jgi:hypothetical protein
MAGYKGVNIDRLRQLSKGAGSAEYFKVEQFNQPMQVRILPGIDEEEPIIEHWLHAGPDNMGWEAGEDTKRKITCLGKECPVCAVAAWAESAGQTSVQEMAQLSKQCYCQVIDRADGKIKIWQMPTTAMKGLIPIMEDCDDITDPKTGRDVRVRKTGTAGNWRSIRYSVTADPKGESALPNDWAATLRPLARVIREYSHEEAQAILYQNLAHLVPLDEILGIKTTKRVAKKPVPPPPPPPKKGAKGARK